MINSQNLQFTNRSGEILSARLELPPVGKPTGFAIFAHCFTCGKNSLAAVSISRELAALGFGVLRFDFTGLGESEGSFADTQFTSNVSDLVAAAHYLEEHYRAPTLLVGHSLGGTAIIHAAAQIPSVKALCTIGAPFEASHVLGLIGDKVEELEQKGKAEVNLGGRPVCIGVDFVNDLREHSTAALLPKLKKPLLILHSPTDQIVGIDQAASLYQAAFHPKSFVALDGADHLLTDKSDARYAADILATWARRYTELLEEKPKDEEEEIVVSLSGSGFTAEVQSGRHQLIADEPIAVGGSDLGPSPFDFLTIGLGACTVMTLRMYASHKKWDLKEVSVRLSHDSRQKKDAESGKNYRQDTFTRKIKMHGNLDEEQKKRLLEIANRCPVHRCLSEGNIEIITRGEEL